MSLLALLLEREEKAVNGQQGQGTSKQGKEGQEGELTWHRLTSQLLPPCNRQHSEASM